MQPSPALLSSREIMPASEMIGRMVSHYRIMVELGRGGRGGNDSSLAGQSNRAAR